MRMAECRQPNHTPGKNQYTCNHKRHITHTQHYPNVTLRVRGRLPDAAERHESAARTGVDRATAGRAACGRGGNPPGTEPSPVRREPAPADIVPVCKGDG